MPEPTILDTILSHKQAEVMERQAKRPLEELQARVADLPPTRDFRAALQAPRLGRVALIAEVKKASPSAGVIRPDFDAIEIARAYDRAGADCLSVLTDERFFQGSDDYLPAIKAAVRLPLLRKDFTVDAYQLYEARTLGADAVLLIAAALTPAQIAEFQGIAHDLGLAALIEVHSEDEMAVAQAVGASLIGINSRDLRSFVTDLGAVERLAALVSGDVTLVAESGLKTPGDIARVADAGAHAILVGETLMRAPDIGEAVRKLLGPA